MRVGILSNCASILPRRTEISFLYSSIVLDYAALESEKAQIQEDLANIDAAATSEAEANRVAYEQAAKIQAEINTKRDAQAKAFRNFLFVFFHRLACYPVQKGGKFFAGGCYVRVVNAKEAARAAAYETNRVADEAARDLAQIQRDEESENKYYSREKSVITASIATAKRRKEGYEAQVADLRKRWEAVNNEQFQEQQAPTAGPLIWVGGYGVVIGRLLCGVVLYGGVVLGIKGDGFRFKAFYFRVLCRV